MKFIRRQYLNFALWFFKKAHQYFQYAQRHTDSIYDNGKAAWETRQMIREVEDQLSKL
jgi:hypothetical protein